MTDPTPEFPIGMPREILFGHVRYTVHVDISEVDLEQPADGQRMGQTEHHFRRIWVNAEEGLSLEQIQNTLLHEVLHCCVNISGLWSNGRPNEVEEQYVNAMTTPLHGVLLNNPELLSWLTKP